MKKIILSLFVLAFVLSFLTACGTTRVNKDDTSVFVEMPLKVLPDVSIGEKQVYGSSSVHSLLWIFTWGDGHMADFNGKLDLANRIENSLNIQDWIIHHAKQCALYEATEPMGSDMLRSPKYTIDYKNFLIYKKASCTVTGFPATVNRLTPAN